MTYSTQIARHVGYENIGGTDADKAWWKQTGAVWVISIVTEDLVIGDFALLNDAFNNTMPGAFSRATTVGPSSRAATVVVPIQGCKGTLKQLFLMCPMLTCPISYKACGDLVSQ